MTHVLSLAAALAAASGALAQTAPIEFPDGAQPLAADALKQRLSGKVFDVALFNGTRWRLQYEGSGYFVINVSPSGYTDSGKWRTEESKLCSEPQKTKAGCNEVRLLADAIYLKRDNGEVIKLVAK